MSGPRQRDAGDSGAVLVGVDHTSEGQAAVTAGIQEAIRRNAEVLLVHYVRVGTDEQELHNRAQGEGLLERAAAAAQAAGVAHQTILELGTASAATTLLGAAAKEGVQVIVIGTRRRSRVGKALLGSDAQQVILGAACPVLCVKGE